MKTIISVLILIANLVIGTPVFAVPVCKDSDSVNDTSKKGTVQVSSAGTVTDEKSDYCYPKDLSSYVRQVGCSAQNTVKTFLAEKCPSEKICHKGACVTNCTAGVCLKDLCKGLTISDGKACTIDSCNKLTGQVSHVAKKFDDGLPCTLDSCDQLTGNASHQSTCPATHLCASTGCIAKCTDTDPQDNPELKGKVTVLPIGQFNLEFEDVCIAGNLLQFSCSPLGEKVQSSYDCAPFGVGSPCSDGTCAKPLPTLVSVSSSGLQGNADADDPAISADGRFVVFSSKADNLVDGDTNNEWDIFIRDLETKKTKRVSVGGAGYQGNGSSIKPSVSADGRFVVFASDSSNLVPGDNNWAQDIFIRDLQEGKIKLVSVSSAGVPGKTHAHDGSISADGKFVAFVSDDSDLAEEKSGSKSNIYIRDLEKNTMKLVSLDQDSEEDWLENDSYTGNPSLAADGKLVAFQSGPLYTKGIIDVFVRDLGKEECELVSDNLLSTTSYSTGYSENISFGANGTIVVFQSTASDLVDGDTNGYTDVFIRDLATKKTELVSVSSAGFQGNGISRYPSVSADGRFVVFGSTASNLVPGDNNSAQDVFIRDLKLKKTLLINASYYSTFSKTYQQPSISADGRFITFTSDFPLVPNDDNGHIDVFITVNPLWQKP